MVGPTHGTSCGAHRGLNALFVMLYSAYSICHALFGILYLSCSIWHALFVMLYLCCLCVFWMHCCACLPVCACL